MRSKVGVEEGEILFKRGKAPSEAVSGRATYTTVAIILYAGLAASVVGEEGCPQKRVSVDDLIPLRIPRFLEASLDQKKKSECPVVRLCVRL